MESHDNPYRSPEAPGAVSRHSGWKRICLGGLFVMPTSFAAIFLFAERTQHALIFHNMGMPVLLFGLSCLGGLAFVIGGVGWLVHRRPEPWRVVAAALLAVAIGFTAFAAYGAIILWLGIGNESAPAGTVLCAGVAMAFYLAFALVRPGRTVP